MIRFVFVCLAFFGSGSADAYIGPGMGAGLIGTVFGVVGALLLAIIGIVYYPIKRMLKKRRQMKSDQKQL